MESTRPLMSTTRSPFLVKSRRVCTTSKWPPQTAAMSGVSPSKGSGALASIGADSLKWSSILTLSVWPHLHAARTFAADIARKCSVIKKLRFNGKESLQ